MEQKPKAAPPQHHDGHGPPSGGGDDGKRRDAAWDPVAAVPLPIIDAPTEPMLARAAQLETQNGAEMQHLFAHLLEEDDDNPRPVDARSKRKT